MSTSERNVHGGSPDTPGVVESALRAVLREHRTERRQAHRRWELMGFRRDWMRRRRWKPPLELREVPDSLVILLLPSPAERIAELRSKAIDAEWIVELTELATADPDSVPAGAMPPLLQLLGRLTSWSQAMHADWMATFARPGVAVPIGDLLQAAMSGDADGAVLESYEAQPSDEDLHYARSYAETSVYGDPVWDAVVAGHASQFAAVEIGTTLHLAPITARRQVAESLDQVDNLSIAHDALRNGTIDRGKVRMIAERTSVLDRDARAAVQERVLGPHAGRDPAALTHGQLRRAVDRAVIECDPAAAERRAEQAHIGRKTHLTPMEDNMSRFSADVQAPVARLAQEVLDSTAKNLPDECRAGRSLNQTRADIFGDIFSSLATYGHVDLRQPAMDRAPTDDNEGNIVVPDGPAVPSWANDSAESGIDGASTPNGAPNGTPNERAGSAVRTAGNIRLFGGTNLPPVWKPLGTSVSVTIAASTLVGLDNDPGHLAGHGWITADLARALATSAYGVRAVIHNDAGDGTPSPEATDLAEQPATTGPADPADPPSSASATDISDPGFTGTSTNPASPAGSAARDIPCAPGGRESGISFDDCDHRNCRNGDRANNRWCGSDIDYGRSVYRPPAALRDLVMQRDGTCRFIGCQAAAQRCDIDHRVPFNHDKSDPAGGVTCPCNLDALCRFHHRLKTFTPWTAVRIPGNQLLWTSPHGQTFVDAPEPVAFGTPFGPADLPSAPPPPF